RWSCPAEPGQPRPLVDARGCRCPDTICCGCLDTEHARPAPDLQVRLFSASFERAVVRLSRPFQTRDRQGALLRPPPPPPNPLQLIHLQRLTHKLALFRKNPRANPLPPAPPPPASADGGRPTHPQGASTRL